MSKLLLFVGWIAAFTLIGLTTPWLRNAAPMQSVIRCWSDSPDPWFVEHVTLQGRTIAPGVGVVPRDNQALLVYNETSIPVYILQPKYDRIIQDEKAGIDETLHVAGTPSHLYVAAKVIKNTVLLWGGYDAGGHEQWMQIDSNQAFARFESHGAFVTTNLSDYFPHYGPRNVYQDFRPAAITPPPEQQFVFSVLYKSQVYPVVLTQTYTLNESYNPIAELASNQCVHLALQAGACGIVLLGVTTAIIRIWRTSKE